MYVILGATGNIGKVITENLLSQGKKVKAIARNPQKLKELSDKGAEIVQGDLLDSKFLAEQFKGATAIFAMIPPIMDAQDYVAHQNKVGSSIADAIKDSDVKYVVHLSSFASDKDHGTGPIISTHYQEQRLNKIEGLNVLHLRPAYFFENLFSNIPLIKSANLIGSTLSVDTKFPAISTKDIGDVASDELLKLSFVGNKVRELLGPEDISMNDAKTAISAALGRDINYVQFSYEDTKKGMMDFGMSESLANLYNELNQGLESGWVSSISKRDDYTKTPTTLKKFTQVFKYIVG